ncbi:hypothetical protein B4099_2704 [Heyndrickxia coagulans]|uniref:Uncharacterized protein n=1 Tax=Heyndrickxia coagulans TaxID=1398 RepID=A0A150KJW4_HEYCO|nr:hypothetical protein B4099_2704 [Heyndrickxia coagulans]
MTRQPGLFYDKFILFTVYFTTLFTAANGFKPVETVQGIGPYPVYYTVNWKNIFKTK